MPQGSILGPTHFYLYTYPLGNVTRRHGISSAAMGGILTQVIGPQPYDCVVGSLCLGWGRTTSFMAASMTVGYDLRVSLLALVVVLSEGMWGSVWLGWHCVREGWCRAVVFAVLCYYHYYYYV